MATVDINNASAIWDKIEKESDYIHAAVMKAVALSVDSELVDATPVDTGRARSNWILTTGSPSSEYKDPFNTNIHSANWKSGKFRKTERGLRLAGRTTNADAAKIQARAALSNFNSVHKEDTIYIVNNTPYIEKLNNGSSKQAPTNFVERAISTGVRRTTDVKIIIT